MADAGLGGPSWSPVGGAAACSSTSLHHRATHGGRTRVAFTVDGGYLLALTMDRGLPEQLAPTFESVLASLEVSPASAR